jgi:Secretion system C-terminal sorting domain
MSIIEQMVFINRFIFCFCKALNSMKNFYFLIFTNAKFKMMKQFFAKSFFVFVSFLFTNLAYAQGTLEWTLNGSDTTTLNQISTSNIVVNFLKDVQNPVVTNFLTYGYYSPTLQATVSLRNQKYSTVLTNTTTTFPGLSFGSRNSSSEGGIAGNANNPQVVGFTNIYNVLGANIPAAQPNNYMYVSSPSAMPETPTNMFGDVPVFFNGGFDAEGITGATGPSGQDANHGIALYTCVEPLADINADKAGRFYYGDIVIKFNRPVINPVIHVGSLGGSYSYQPLLGGPNQISYFTTELELENTNVTTTLMAGNAIIELDGNNILNNATKPNAGSLEDFSTLFGFSTYGAACGSVRINGTVQEITYKVYLRGSTQSNFSFSKKQADITSANRDPLNGDFWYLSVSLDKPTQQISGNVFIDRDGLTNNNINQSFGIANPKTSVGNTLFANLLNSSGNVVASTAISSDGVYLFDNVPIGVYSVQLTTIPSAGTYASPLPAPITNLPPTWKNTGEYIGAGAGNDFNIDGKSAFILLNTSELKVQVNFGIEQIPETVNFLRFIPTPMVNDILTLNGVLPTLSGSDPEDQIISGTLSGKKLRIDTLPTNALLYYNGVLVITGQIIPNYVSSLLTIKLTTVPPFTDYEVKFNYSYIDAADFPDPTPAYYILRWSSTVVPITLADFKVSKNDCTANLNWTTNTEINADKFEIEYSTNSIFNKIGTVVLSGNSTTPKDYQFNFSMQTGINYFFRLKMINKDGSFANSNIKAINCNNGKVEIAISPNPTLQFFHITGMLDGKNIASIYSKDGKLLSNINVVNYKDIDVSNLSTGIYIIKIMNENGSVVVKRLIKK